MYAYTELAIAGELLNPFLIRPAHGIPNAMNSAAFQQAFVRSPYDSISQFLSRSAIAGCSPFDPKTTSVEDLRRKAKAHAEALAKH